MHVFDTNVLSEIMRAEPDAAVAAWLRACPVEAMYTTVISQTEILYGVRRLPDGGRRVRLAAAAHAMFAQTFAARVLPFDGAAAEACADIRAARARIGRPIATEDAMIAAVARRVGASVVTRDAGGFAGCGVLVVDPWEGGG